MSERSPRPGQATFAAWLIIGGSVILVITAWQRVSELHTLEVQEELQRVLSEPPVSGTGLSLEALKTTIRVLCMIAAGAATASTILGVQALRRSTSARLALTLLSPLVLVGGFATAGFFAPMVVAGIVMLWLHPTREWFAGRPWITAPPGPRPDPFAAAPPRQDGPPAQQQPPHLDRPAAEQPGPFTAPYAAPAHPPGWPQPAAVAGAKRPAALITACVLTWATCAAVAGMMVMLSLVLAVARDELFAEIESQQPGFRDQLGGLSYAEVATSVYVLTAVTVVWCAVAAVLAFLAFRGLQWARIALAICTGAAGLVALAAALVSPGLVVLVAATSVTVWLLLRSDVTDWYRSRGTR